MDWGSIFATLLLDLVITVLGYLLVPTILSVRHKSLTNAQIKQIVIINGIVVWFAFRLLISALGGEPGSGAAVFLWSAVAHWMLKKNCLKTDGSVKKDCSDAPSVSLPPESKTPNRCGNYSVPASDLRLEENESYSAPSTHKEKNSTKTKRFCSKCGGEINVKTKQCTKCGKQYFKGFSKIGIALVLVSIFLAISIIFNVWQIEVNKVYKETLKEQELSLSGLQSDLIQMKVEYEAELSLYHEHVVCVPDGGSSYHKYGCSYLMLFDKSDFLIFSVDGAKAAGYYACPHCMVQDKDTPEFFQ